MDFDRLFSPAKLGTLELKNRIVMPAITTNLASVWGEVTEDMLEWYALRARGGTGLILVEAAFVATAIDQIRNPLLALRADDDCYCTGLYRLAEAIHDGGSKAGIQLSPGLGAQARAGPFIPGRQYVEDVMAVGPSPVASPEAKRRVRALTIEDIQKMVKLFAVAAQRVKRIGFDLIEIHGHAGHLLAQFMSPYFNKRTDQYGGDINGRLRFMLEIIEAVRGEVGAKFPLTVKYSIDEFIDGGRDLKEGLIIAERLQRAGIDGISVSAGIHGSKVPSVPPMYYPEATMLPLAEALKRVVTLPLVLQGRLSNPALAENILQQSKADFIGIGRQLIADPDYPSKLEDGRINEIRPCIYCNGCMEGVTLATGSALRCTVNPTAGRERTYGAIRPADKHKRVVVVGAGPAGMEAARIAAIRGHEVVIFEKNKTLNGGQLSLASKPPHKEVIGQITDYYSKQFQQFANVRISLGKEATAKDIKAEKPDAVIIATGGKPLLPDIPGINRKLVVTAFDIVGSKSPVKKSAIVVGGELVGCETAHFLAKQGKKVTILEALDTAASDMEPWCRRALLAELRAAQVDIVTSTEVVEVTDNGAIGVNRNGARTLYAADTVVIALGMVPVNELAKELRGKVKQLYLIGDAKEPRRIKEAIAEGFITGYNL